MEPRQCQFRYADPSLPQARLIFKEETKCELLAGHLERRLSAKEEMGTAGPRVDTREGPIVMGLAGQRRNCYRGSTPFSSVTSAEVARAINSVAIGRPPGPDGFRVEISKRLPSVVETVRILRDQILITEKLLR